MFFCRLKGWSCKISDIKTRKKFIVSAEMWLFDSRPQIWRRTPRTKTTTLSEWQCTTRRGDLQEEDRGMSPEVRVDEDTSEPRPPVTSAGGWPRPRAASSSSSWPPHAPSHPRSQVNVIKMFKCPKIFSNDQKYFQPCYPDLYSLYCWR